MQELPCFLAQLDLQRGNSGMELPTIQIANGPRGLAFGLAHTNLHPKLVKALTIQQAIEFWSPDIDNFHIIRLEELDPRSLAMPVPSDLTSEVLVYQRS
jgi:hypothetical protein